MLVPGCMPQILQQSDALCAPCTAAKPKLPPDFEDTTWAKLQAAVRAVHNKQPVSCSLEELYRVRHQSSTYA